MLLRSESLLTAGPSHCLLHFFLHFPSRPFAVIHRQLNDFETVFDEAVLDICIHRGFHVETRSVIHFNHPRLKLLVQHDVKSKQFEAAIWLLCLT
jgi:hypothetical protein